MLYTFYVLPVILILISLTSARSLQTPQGPPGGRRPPVFADVDKNGDGRIGREEWQGPSEVFDRLDTNKDGSISQDEFKAGPRRGPGGPPPADHLLTLLDSNADGNVSESEFRQITQLFDRLDQNKDGSLTRGELEGFFRPSGNAPMATRSGPGGANPGGPRNPPDFTSLDTNGDKKISRDEWHGPPQSFDQVDSSGNGTIEESEWSARQSRMPPPGGGFGGHILEFLDADGDQKVSQTEFAALAQLFGSLDTDHDGALTKDELAGFFHAIG
jgi:Ca2+-binding EF-hand superfamily protein